MFLPTNSQIQDQQIQFSLSNYSRPSWSTLPVSNPTKSFWTDAPGANPLAREGSSGPLGFGGEDIDICVIGSGITGISAVYHLQRLLDAQGLTDVDKKVVVLEAREFCEYIVCHKPWPDVDTLANLLPAGSGATGRNGGHLTRNPFNGFAFRESHYGSENAKKSYLLEDYVTSSIVDIVHSHGLFDTVDLVKGDHITLFLTEEEAQRALEDYRDAQEGGVNLKDVKFLDRETMLGVCAFLSDLTIALIKYSSLASYRRMELITPVSSFLPIIFGPSNSLRVFTTYHL